MGGASGRVGGPIGEPNRMLGDQGGGVVQAFQGGAFAWSAAHGAHVVTGNVLTTLSAAGGIEGPLGWPTAAQVCADGTCTQSFMGGVVTWSPAYGGRSFTVEMYEAYQ